MRDRALLIDPSYHWFGAPHKQFQILDDLEIIAKYLSTFPDLKRNQIAAKLAPESLSVQNSLCWSYVELQRWTEAERVLRVVERLDSVGALSANLHAGIAVRKKDFAKAESYLRRAIEIDPRQSHGHISLGAALANQGKYTEAREEFQKSVLLPHTEAQGRMIKEFLAKIDSVAPQK
jgi:tetratricopeptide (TPR) repeat protein